MPISKEIKAQIQELFTKIKELFTRVNKLERKFEPLSGATLGPTLQTPPPSPADHRPPSPAEYRPTEPEPVYQEPVPAYQEPVPAYQRAAAVEPPYAVIDDSHFDNAEYATVNGNPNVFNLRANVNRSEQPANGGAKRRTTKRRTTKRRTTKRRTNKRRNNKRRNTKKRVNRN